MPTTYNGIGTHYYGNRNSTTHFGFCNQCKRQQMLTDYETTLWFCVIYIPIIPLGKKQIVNQCPGCTYHYAVPLKNWQKQGDEAVDKVSDTLAQNTNDPEKVIELHATLSGFHRHEEAGDLAKVMLAKFGGNSNVLFHLASWHEHFTRFKEADELFVKASDAAPADMEMLAASVFALARQNEVDAAVKRMGSLEPPAIPHRAALVRHVARQFAVNQRHADAYKLLISLLEAAPALKESPDFQAEVRPLEKKLGVKQSVVPSEAFWRKPIAKWMGLGVAAVVALVALEGWNFYVQQNAPIHAVNGVNVPIEFSIDDGPAKVVPAKGRITFHLPEGRHRIALLKPKLPGADPYEVDIHQAWHRRFFSKAAFVLDPSRTAVVLHLKAPYSEGAQFGVAPEYAYHAGEGLTQYPHVDHRFEELPTTVDLGSSRVVYRTGLRLMDLNPLALSQVMDMRRLAPLAQRRLAADPSDSTGLEYLAAIMLSEGKGAELVEFVKPRLADDPPRVTWHRVYQNLVQDKKALSEEYDRRLAEHPASGVFLYLRGRICESSTQATEFYDRAIAADPGLLFAYLAKSLELKSRAKYVEAEEVAAKAWDQLQANPASLTPSDVKYFRERIGQERLENLISAGRYDEFDQFELTSRGVVSGGEENPLVYLSKLRKGNADAIAQHKSSVAGRLARMAPVSPFLSAQLRLTNAMYEGDLVTMRQAASQMPEPPRQQLLDAIAFDEGVDPICKTVLDATNEMAPILQKLMTSLRAREMGQPFEAARDEAIGLMKSSEGMGAALAKLFEKSPAATIEELNEIALQGRERGIILVALAEENPSQKEAMLRYARQLLTIPALPQKRLEAWIARGLGE
jgi:tetratricopeptide (TPR) repeat protein